MKKIIALFFVTLLGGCVLQSKEPNFSDADGKMMLGEKGGKFMPYSIEHGEWQSEKTAVSFVAVGHHYEFVEKNKTTDITFVPIAREWWVAQFHENGGPTVYVFANKQPDAIYIHPLACTNLKINGWAQTNVSFKNEDCTLTSKVSGAEFKGLLTAAGPRTMKMVLQK